MAHQEKAIGVCEVIPLPAYIDPDAWAGFVEMRQAMPKSKPFTSRAAKLILYELQRLKDAGHDPNASLDQSTKHGWADVYEPREKPISRKQGTHMRDPELMKLDELAKTATKPPPNIRRVA